MATTKQNVLRIIVRDLAVTPEWIMVALAYRSLMPVRIALSQLLAEGRISKNLYGQDSDGRDVYRLSEQECLERSASAALKRAALQIQAKPMDAAKEGVA